MDPVEIQGEVFSEYFLRTLMWQDRKLAPLLDEMGARERYRRASQVVRLAQRNLAERRAVRSTQSLLLAPLAELLDWHLGAEMTVATGEGDERAGLPLLGQDDRPVSRILALPPEASMDAAPEGRHRRFAPTLSLVRVLEEQGLSHGLLVNAYRLRLVRRAERFVASYVDFDLSGIAEGAEAGFEAWRTVWALLRQAAWEQTPAVLDQVVAQGRDHAARVSVGLGQQVQQAVVAFIQGLLSHPANQGKVENPPSRAQLDQFYQQSLRVLYRLLFALYAEDRGLLPVDIPTYRDGYSLRRLSRWVRDPQTDPRRSPTIGGRFVESSLRALFDLLRDGADLGPEGRIPAYGGGLFDPEQTQLVDSLAWGESTCAEVVARMTWVPAGERGQEVHLSYRELDVEQLGSVYESLLEQSVDCATEPMWRVRLDDRFYVVTDAQRRDLAARRGEVVSSELEALLGAEEEEEADEEPEVADEVTAEEDDDEEAEEAPPSPRKPLRVLARIEPGTVFLRAGMGRKQTGSYYTNRAFVDFLVRRTVDPLAEGKTAEEILALKVVDPAMGSGHFLVGACRRLSEHLLAAYQKMDPEEVPQDVTRVWAEEERALTACRLLVAGHCIYGVDKNPLAVDLARVSLWLATAAADHPLTFLDHRLRVGDSLLGMKADDLLRPWAPLPTKGKKPTKKSHSVFPLVGRPLALEELYEGAGRMLRERLRRAFAGLRSILELADNRPEDLAAHRNAYQAMLGELQPFWDLHCLRLGLAFLDAPDPEVINTWLRDIGTLGRLEDGTRSRGAAAWRKGRDLGAFCWDLAFPDVWFSEEGKPRENGGFDVVVGNPPWERLKPEKKGFYSQFDPGIYDHQAAGLKHRIAEIDKETAGISELWAWYVEQRREYPAALLSSGIYARQRTRVRGRMTGGDPDLFRFFTERSFQLMRRSGNAGILVPDSLYSEAGCTGLRRMLWTECRVQDLLVFQNHRRRFFPTHSQFKFVVLPFSKDDAGTGAFRAAFSLTDEAVLYREAAGAPPESVAIPLEFLRLTSPEHLAVPEVRSQRDIDLMQRVCRAIPALRTPDPDTWAVTPACELHMSNDNHLFRDRAWLQSHGCMRSEGEMWLAQEADWYERMGWSRRDETEGMPPGRRYVRPDEFSDERAPGVIAGEWYAPLYEGRLVHQFDHAAKAYASGEAARAIWLDTDFPKSEVVPHFFVAAGPVSTGPVGSRGYRAAFCGVSNQSNERTFLAALVPPGCPCGHRVPVVVSDVDDPRVHLVFLALANAFTTDWLFRLRVTTTLDFFIVEQWPAPRLPLTDPRAHQLWVAALRLSCFTPHMAAFWNDVAASYPDTIPCPWQSGNAATRLTERAHLRAEIDAIVTDLYGLSVEEFAYILTTFPLLDRSQPALPGDAFIRRTNKGEQTTPRSYITRDTALLEYCRYKGVAPPEDIVAFYAGIGVDISRQTGPLRNLEERVAEATRLGAIAYVPTPTRRPRGTSDA